MIMAEITKYETVTKMSLLGNIAILSIIIFFLIMTIGEIVKIV